MKARWTLSIVAVAFGLAGAALAADAPKPEVAPAEPVAAVEALEPLASVDPAEGVDACELNFTPADPEEAALSAKPPCKPCRDQSFCKCSYNGLPRVSCDPCCYGNLGIPQICSS